MPAWASIINIAFVGAYNPPQILVDYVITKVGIVALSKALAEQQVAMGIRVNAVPPGPVWKALQPSGGQPQEAVEKFGSEVPLGRSGQPVSLPRSTCSYRLRMRATEPARSTAPPAAEVPLPTRTGLSSRLAQLPLRRGRRELGWQGLVLQPVNQSILRSN
ncbi:MULTISPECIES: SDR family oxidoreductase [Methylobacteriaceae]|uniref:SDR family oxidoreductase n=1 Tax=Methylobacteriaceae TaxID=119045 RepID=UPI002F356218